LVVDPSFVDLDPSLVVDHTLVVVVHIDQLIVDS
jgi:hypothetical protein